MIAENTWYLILNPVSGNGKAKNSWPKIKKALDKEGVEVQFCTSSYKGDVCNKLIKAVSDGYRNFIIVGGDGSIHEAVNGIMLQKSCSAEDIGLAVIPVGTGNDWIKTHGLSKNLKTAISIIKKKEHCFQDIGEIEFQDVFGGKVYFNNLAGFGFDGHVIEKVEKIKHFGVFAYLMGALSGMMNYKPITATIETEKESFGGKIFMMAAGIGKFSGGGMRLTHYSGYKNGHFDLSLAQDFSSKDLIWNLLRVFTGKIKRSRKVKTFSANSVKVKFNQSDSALIQADGELLGRGDFKISIHPLKLKVYK